MEIYCADCGCLIDRDVRLIPCASPECCCLDLPLAAQMETTAARIRTAFNARDMDAFRELIANDATWGEDIPNACHNRDGIVRTYKRFLDEGVRGTVVETAVGPRGVACLLEVEWSDPENHSRGPRFYQVFLVHEGLVTKIEGHDDRDLALASISNIRDEEVPGSSPGGPTTTTETARAPRESALGVRRPVSQAARRRAAARVARR